MPLTQADLETGLRQLGLQGGDTVIVHSSLASLGQVEGAAGAVVQAFLQVLGPAGTLVVPAFGALGIIPEVVKAHPRAVRSIHPLAAVAAIGARAGELCRDHWKAELAHGGDTPYTRIAEAGGYVCLLGVDQDRNTTLHTVEEMLRLPYLKQTADHTFDTPEGTVTKAWPFFPGPHRDFIGLDHVLRRSGKMKTGRIGNAVVRLIKSRDLIALGTEVLRQNPAFALCGNPNCDACVGQRAALRRARLAQETFQLAASAHLAGRYIPEMIEQCARAGVAAVELDVVQGRPVESCTPDDILRFADDLRAGGLHVTALRGRSTGQRALALIAAAAAGGIKRVVLPFSSDSAGAAAAAQQHEVTISFFNTIQDSETNLDMLQALAGNGINPRFTFSAAGFARLGENPFLGSFRKQICRFVDQLDVADCLYDGTPKALAEGNAEIKELISRLRCAGFDGYLVLGAENRAAGATLPETATRLVSLLEAM